MHGSRAGGGRFGGVCERIRAQRARRERLRLEVAIRYGGFTDLQVRLLGMLVDGPRDPRELVNLSSSGARPSRAIKEATDSLIAQGVVFADTNWDYCIAPPEEWLGRSAIRRIDAEVAAELKRQSAEGPSPDVVLEPGQLRVVGVSA